MPFAALNTMSRAAAKATKARGAWEGSPSPEAGEAVLFVEHFACEFGLPAIVFLSGFLTHFGLQPHHLAANVVLQLAAYVTLCESFLGVESGLDMWCQLFYLKQQWVPGGTTGNKQMPDYGVSLVHHRTASGFPKIPFQDSVKKRQKGFLYMNNIDPKNDNINLPHFVLVPPSAKLN
ncbi:hypothetical protein D1007_56659 [Hordeum vulgare]|nr:hypothetical protein D1007_56659 [Hordeum vulgare]